MDNPAFICDGFRSSKVIDAEEKLLIVRIKKQHFTSGSLSQLFLLQKKLNEAFATKNLEKFKMLLQRPIRRTLSALKNQDDDSLRVENPSVFYRFKMFRSFSFKMQPDIEASSSNYQQKFPCNNLLSQNILCYRKRPDDLSLLEKIMREPESEDFIAFVWSECDFWRDSSSLMMVIRQI